MCRSVYENTHIERVNGIIKNEYLQNKAIRVIEDLQKELKLAIRLYNSERPHWSLECRTPEEYEKELRSKSMREREVLILYSENPRNYIEETLFD